MNPPLLQASLDGNLLKVIELIPTSTPEEIDLAMVEACYNGHSEITTYLINAGANIDINSGQPIREAVLTGFVGIVDILIKAGADIHRHCGWAIRCASAYGYLDIVKLLVQANADISVCDDEALVGAVHAQQISIVRLLLSIGADVHTRNDYLLKIAPKNVLPLLLQHDLVGFYTSNPQNSFVRQEIKNLRGIYKFLINQPRMEKRLVIRIIEYIGYRKTDIDYFKENKNNN